MKRCSAKEFWACASFFFFLFYSICGSIDRAIKIANSINKWKFTSSVHFLVGVLYIIGRFDVAGKNRLRPQCRLHPPKDEREKLDEVLK